MLPWLLDKLLSIVKFFMPKFKIVLIKNILVLEKFPFSSSVEKRYGFKPFKFMIKFYLEGKIYNKLNKNQNIDKIFIMMKQSGKENNSYRLISWKGRLLQPNESYHFGHDVFLPDEIIKELYSDYTGEFELGNELKSYLVNKLPSYFYLKFEFHNEEKIIYKKEFKLNTGEIKEKYLEEIFFEIGDNTEQLKENPEVLLDNKKLNSLMSVISNTIKDFENFTFNTKYDFNSNSMIEIIRKITGKDAVKIFIKSVQKILENNIRSGHALKKDSLNKLFTDGILENVNDLNFLLETIIKTIELIKSLGLYKKQNTHLIYEFKKFIRYINENLIKHKEKFIKIEKELLPNAVELCKKQSVDTTELSELIGEFNEINSYFEKINQYYRSASNENGIFISVQPKKGKTELVENAVIDRATKILAKDNMEKLRIFAEHMTEKMSLETATKGLLQTDNIEDYIKKVTGKEVEIIEYKELDKIKNIINQRGYVIISYATWEPAKRYDGLGEGIIHWVITKEKKVLLNREGLDVLNTYHAGFKEEISNHKLS